MPNGEATAEELEQQQALDLARQQEAARTPKRQAPAATPLPGGEVAEKITELAKRIPVLGQFLGLIQNNFPVLFWIITNLAKSFSFWLILVGLGLLPFVWTIVCWLALIGGKVRLPLLPLNFPKPTGYELVVSTTITLLLITAMVMSFMLLVCTSFTARLSIKAYALLGSGKAQEAAEIIKFCEETVGI